MPLLKFAQYGVSWTSDTIKVLLSEDAPTDAVYADDLTECSGTGYSRQTLGSKTVTDNGDYLIYDAADVTFSTITVADVAYAYVVKDTGDDSTSVIIGYFDIRDNGTPRNVINDDLILQFSANGIFHERYQA